MYCTHKGCQEVIDLRKAKDEGRKVTCSNLTHMSCRLCKQEYHGEKGACRANDGLRVWHEGLVGIETGHCPKCQAFLVKDGGCPEMSCTICGYNYCWTCGLEWRNFMH